VNRKNVEGSGRGIILVILLTFDCCTVPSLYFPRFELVSRKEMKTRRQWKSERAGIVTPCAQFFWLVKLFLPLLHKHSISTGTIRSDLRTTRFLCISFVPVFCVGTLEQIYRVTDSFMHKSLSRQFYIYTAI